MPDAQNTVIEQSVLDQLKLVSTPTLATALYKRGLRCQMIQNVHPLGPIKQAWSVMDSRGDARAASAGGILVRRLMMRGAAGIKQNDNSALPAFLTLCRALFSGADRETR